jgi:hypothetical protein
VIGVQTNYNLTTTSTFLSWSGLQSLTDSIEIDFALAKLMALNPQMSVDVTFLSPAVANSINVSPLSADDWEILETNSEWLEDNLMTQVRVVAAGQILPLWVHNLAIFVRVGKHGFKNS